MLRLGHSRPPKWFLSKKYTLVGGLWKLQGHLFSCYLLNVLYIAVHTSHEHFLVESTEDAFKMVTCSPLRAFLRKASLTPGLDKAQVSLVFIYS